MGVANILSTAIDETIAAPPPTQTLTTIITTTTIRTTTLIITIIVALITTKATTIIAKIWMAVTIIVTSTTPIIVVVNHLPVVETSKEALPEKTITLVENNSINLKITVANLTHKSILEVVSTLQMVKVTVIVVLQTSQINGETKEINLWSSRKGVATMQEYLTTAIVITITTTQIKVLAAMLTTIIGKDNQNRGPDRDHDLTLNLREDSETSFPCFLL